MWFLVDEVGIWRAWWVVMRLFTFRFTSHARMGFRTSRIVTKKERTSNLLDSNNLISCLGGSPSGYPQLGVLLDGGAGRPGAAADEIVAIE